MNNTRILEMISDYELVEYNLDTFCNVDVKNYEYAYDLDSCMYTISSKKSNEPELILFFNEGYSKTSKVSFRGNSLKFNLSVERADKLIKLVKDGVNLQYKLDKIDASIRLLEDTKARMLSL